MCSLMIWANNRIHYDLIVVWPNADPVHRHIYVALGEMSWFESNAVRFCFEQTSAEDAHNKQVQLYRPSCVTLEWRHNGHNGVSNHQPHDCLLNHLFSHRSKKTSKACVTGLCDGNSVVTGEFPAQRASNMEKASIWWHHHEIGTAVFSSHFVFENNKTVIQSTNKPTYLHITLHFRQCIFQIRQDMIRWDEVR